MRRIALAAHKGGVGKTTSAVNLSVALARAGQKVLLIDCDAQGNCTSSFGIGSDASPGVFGLMVGGVGLADVLVPVEENLDLVPASRALSTIDAWLLQRPRPADVLRKRLGDVEGYDFAFADLPPSFGQMALNALMFATEAWIPVSMEFYALSGVKQTLDTLRMLRDEADHHVNVRMVIPTFVDVRNAKTRSVLTSLEKTFGTRLTPPVRTSVRLSEAPSHHKNIFDYAPMSAGASDYNAIAERVLNGEASTVRN